MCSICELFAQVINRRDPSVAPAAGSKEITEGSGTKTELTAVMMWPSSKSSEPAKRGGIRFRTKSELISARADAAKLPPPSPVATAALLGAEPEAARAASAATRSASRRSWPESEAQTPAYACEFGLSAPHGRDRRNSSSPSHSSAMPSSNVLDKRSNKLWRWKVDIVRCTEGLSGFWLGAWWIVPRGKYSKSPGAKHGFKKAGDKDCRGRSPLLYRGNDWASGGTGIVELDLCRLQAFSPPSWRTKTSTSSQCGARPCVPGGVMYAFTPTREPNSDSSTATKRASAELSCCGCNHWMLQPSAKRRLTSAAELGGGCGVSLLDPSLQRNTFNL
mmetsp:Transcript_56492/g.160157  ORF Transcript_56492/g.160157 Transcript_56492/m.160157 type:complete len:333 (-) Transcript_56492:347-1345(-)